MIDVMGFVEERHHRTRAGIPEEMHDVLKAARSLPQNELRSTLVKYSFIEKHQISPLQ